jgi:hypothetical protein
MVFWEEIRRMKKILMSASYIVREGRRRGWPAAAPR